MINTNLPPHAGGLLPAGEGEGRGAGAALGVGEGAAAPVRRLLQEVGELPLLLGQHALGRPRRRSVSSHLGFVCVVQANPSGQLRTPVDLVPTVQAAGEPLL